MSTEQKKSRLAHVPSIMAGAAALIAAVSTLYVNLRDDSQTAREPALPSRHNAAPAAAPTRAPAPGKPKAVLLRLDRVQVDNDGSVGSTDWSFQVSVDGDPLFLVPMPSLNDKPGENLARPADRQQASAELEFPAGKSVVLSVTGWKRGLLPGADEQVSGKSWMAADFSKTSVKLSTDQPKGPRFILYFVATPAK